MLKLIGPFSQILTMSTMPSKGPLNDDELTCIRAGGIVLENDKIVVVDTFKNLLKDDKYSKAEIIEINVDSICMPGFIDCHTHICYAGSRAEDYARRNSGMSYLEIANEGGGIWDTVTKTRSATKEQLVESMLGRILSLSINGITTVEVKSGYGLSVSEEIKMLQSIQLANELSPIDIIPTCLAAHICPKDPDYSSKAYLDYISRELLPTVIATNLSKRVDAFVEKEAFGIEESRKYLNDAKRMGFQITLHADQFTPMGSIIGVDLGAVSVDHLEASTAREIEIIAKSNTVATALPGATIGLGCAFTPARKLLDQGACLAIASDWNPGSAPMGHLLTQAAILGTFEKLTAAEIFAGITYRAAKGLNLQDRGVLSKGMKADFILFEGSDYREILYHQGRMTPVQVWKNGKRI